jgi:hypothetical protein
VWEPYTNQAVIRTHNVSGCEDLEIANFVESNLRDTTCLNMMTQKQSFANDRMFFYDWLCKLENINLHIHIVQTRIHHRMHQNLRRQKFLTPSQCSEFVSKTTPEIVPIPSVAFRPHTSPQCLICSLVSDLGLRILPLSRNLCSFIQ